MLLFQELSSAWIKLFKMEQELSSLVCHIEADSTVWLTWLRSQRKLSWQSSRELFQRQEQLMLDLVTSSIILVQLFTENTAKKRLQSRLLCWLTHPIWKLLIQSSLEEHVLNSISLQRTKQIQLFQSLSMVMPRLLHRVSYTNASRWPTCQTTA
jgi:hypothetical protein